MPSPSCFEVLSSCYQPATIPKTTKLKPTPKDKDNNKENSISRSRWSDKLDELLAGTLIIKKNNGFQTDSASFKKDAFNAARDALSTSHLIDGGLVKDANTCKTRCNAVCMPNLRTFTHIFTPLIA